MMMLGAAAFAGVALQFLGRHLCERRFCENGGNPGADHKPVEVPTFHCTAPLNSTRSAAADVAPTVAHVNHGYIIHLAPLITSKR